MIPETNLQTLSDRAGDLYVRLGVPLQVRVEAAQQGIFVRGDLEKMNWAAYQSISLGLRKVIAARLNVEAETLAMNKLLVVDQCQVTQYVEIIVPSNQGPEFVSADTQADVDLFLRVVKGEPLPADEEIAPARSAPGGVDGPTYRSRHSLAASVGQEVRAAVGGKTLPAPCTIVSPGWGSPLQLSGKLGDKVRKPSSEPEELTVDGTIDGYIKSQRVLHVLPLSTGVDENAGARRDGRKVIAFDEERWFDVISTLAARRGQVARVTYLRVNDGKKDLLQLSKLEPIAPPGDMQSEESE